MLTILCRVSTIEVCLRYSPFFLAGLSFSSLQKGTVSSFSLPNYQTTLSSRICNRSNQSNIPHNHCISDKKLGSTAIGVCTSEGVVLGVEKRVTSILLESSSIEKIVEIDTHIGCAMSGLTADARTMIDHARLESQNHRFTYDEPLRVESCTQAVCDLALRFGEGDDDENERVMSRPFGVALLVAGVDDDGPQLYLIYGNLLM